MLQLRRPIKALNPNWCILCRKSSEIIDHLFLHFPITLGLWHKIFSQAGMDWVQPSSISDMLVISFKCFGNSITGKTFWRIASLSLSLSLVVCVEREKCQDFLGHLEDARDVVGSASFLCFFLGLLYKHFLTLSFECNPPQLAPRYVHPRVGFIGSGFYYLYRHFVPFVQPSLGQRRFTQCFRSHGLLYLLCSLPWLVEVYLVLLIRFVLHGEDLSSFSCPFSLLIHIFCF